MIENQHPVMTSARYGGEGNQSGKLSGRSHLQVIVQAFTGVRSNSITRSEDLKEVEGVLTSLREFLVQTMFTHLRRQ